MNSFQLSITGHNVAPESVDLADLIDILENLQAALTVTAKDRGASLSAIQMSLVGIEQGSDLLTIVSDRNSYLAFEAISDAIANRDVSDLPYRTRTSVYNLWKKTERRGWKINLMPSIGHIRATISEDTDLEFVPTIKGESSLMCMIVRVGGTPRPTASINLPYGAKMTIQLAHEAMAIKLGENLYQSVVLNGEATWARDTWDLVDFKAKSIGDFDANMDVVAACDALAQIAGSKWDDIDDPTEYVRGLREDSQAQ